MGEQIKYNNTILKSTIDNIHAGLSGLYDAEVKRKQEIIDQTSARISADDAITGRLSSIQTSIGSGGSLGQRVTDLETNLNTLTSTVSGNYQTLSGALSGQQEARAQGDVTAEQNAKDYTDSQLSGYRTGTEISGFIATAKTEAIDSAAATAQGKVDSLSTTFDGKLDSKGEVLSAYADAKADEALTSGKAYTDETIGSYSTATSGDNTVYGKLKAEEAAREAADASLQASIDTINAKSISGSEAISAITSDGATTVSLLLDGNDKILTQSADGLKTTVSIKKFTDNLSSDTFAAQYALVGINDEELGQRITIYKDQVLSGASYDESTQDLTLVWYTANGSTASTTIDLSHLIDTYTAGDGLGLSGTQFRVVKDETSESYLTVGENGIKISGIDDAITAAISGQVDARNAAISDVSALLGDSFTSTSTVTNAISNINTAIDTINSQLGGSGDGSSVTDRIAALEDAAVISVTSGNPLLVEMNSSGVISAGTGNWKLNPDFNPGINLAFNNRVIEYGATKITFAGTVTTTKLADGEVKVQIGDNMNSSSFNSTDGKTSGVVADISTSTGYLNGTTVNGTKASSVSWKSAGNIHFDDGANNWKVTIKVDNEEVVVATLIDALTIDYTNASIAGGATAGLTWVSSQVAYTKGGDLGSVVTTSIANKAVEDNYPSSVGGRATRTFFVDLSKLDAANKSIQVIIEGCGGTFTSKKFYYITGSTPAVASATLAVNNAATKKVSGVQYYTTNTTFTFTTGNITNLNNQLTTTGNKLTFASSNVSVPGSIAATTVSSPLVDASMDQDNICTYSNTSIAVAANKNASSASITITPVNYYGSGSGVTGSISNILINTIGTSSTDTVQNCQSENKRLTTSDLTTAFNSNASLATDQLQVIPGDGIQYPSTDYSSYTPADNPNYNGLTGTRYFTRKFTKAGSLPGATLTIVSNSALNGSNVILQASKDGSTWFDINFKSATNQLGKSDSTYGTTSTIVFNWSDGDANGFFYFRVGMASTGIKITKITLA